MQSDRRTHVSALSQCIKCGWGALEGWWGWHLRAQLGSGDGSTHMIQQVWIHHSVHHCGRTPQEKFDLRGCRIEILQVLCQAGIRRCCPLVHLERRVCS